MNTKPETEAIQALDSLFHEVGTYKKSTEYMQLLEFIRKFPYYSPYNAHLLYMQKPGCHYVAMASTWEKEFKRTIKPGARPLIILVPFGPVGYVFDLDETDGKPFPDNLLHPFKTGGSIPDGLYRKLVSNLPCIGIRYAEADYGSQMAGKIEPAAEPKDRGSPPVPCKRNQTQILYKKSHEVHLKVLYNIIVNKNHSKNDIFPTILHELAHLFCGHLNDEHTELFSKIRIKNRRDREFEAESVAWLVCERMGIYNPSEKYLAGYSGKNATLPDISLDCILSSAGKIEDMIHKNIKPIKDIIVKE